MKAPLWDQKNFLGTEQRGQLLKTDKKPWVSPEDSEFYQLVNLKLNLYNQMSIALSRLYHVKSREIVTRIISKTIISGGS